MSVFLVFPGSAPFLGDTPLKKQHLTLAIVYFPMHLT